MLRIELPNPCAPTLAPVDPETAEVRFPLSEAEQQVDLVHLGRPGEVHVNMALGRLCAVGCRECSAAQLARTLVWPIRGSLGADSIGRKARALGDLLAPLLAGRRLVVSTMNDDDPLLRPPDELADIVGRIFAGFAAAGAPLDRLNLSSSLVSVRPATVRALAERYAEVCGGRLVQLQASLLATPVKRSIFAGDGAHLATIAGELGFFRERMLAAAGRGEVWVNYVAVRRGDFGRADGADRLDSVARVAEPLARTGPGIVLKLTRGSVEGLEGWEQLGAGEYAAFAAAVRARWAGRLTVYCPDLDDALGEEHRCGRLQALGAGLAAQGA